MSIRNPSAPKVSARLCGEHWTGDRRRRRASLLDAQTGLDEQRAKLGATLRDTLVVVDPAEREAVESVCCQTNLGLLDIGIDTLAE